MSNFQFNWSNLLLAAAVLWGLWFILQFLRGIMRGTNFMGDYRQAVADGIRYILLIYEPLVLLILGSVFVLINPVFHGLIMGLIFISGFNGIKNYINGRQIQFDTSLTVGNRMKVENLQGIISKTGRLGLHLKSNKGLQFIPYSHLYSNGFMILSGEEIGGYYQLKITPTEPDKKTNYKIKLTDLLVTSPYLDRNHTPEILPSLEIPNQLNAKIMVNEESHLYELISLIQEWGFECQISKK